MHLVTWWTVTVSELHGGKERWARREEKILSLEFDVFFLLQQSNGNFLVTCTTQRKQLPSFGGTHLKVLKARFYFPKRFRLLLIKHIATIHVRSSDGVPHFTGLRLNELICWEECLCTLFPNRVIRQSSGQKTMSLDNVLHLKDDWLLAQHQIL